MEERTITVNGTRLWTLVQGTGPLLVLCHGGPGLYDYLEPIAVMVDDLCTVIRYDQRGSGRSDGRPPYTVQAFAADLEGLRQAFGSGPWMGGGHSWGADLALAYAASYPESTRALIYVSGRGLDPAWHETYHANRLRLLDEADRAAYLNLRTRRQTAAGRGYQRIVSRLRAMNRRIDVADPAHVTLLPGFDDHPVNDHANRQINADWETLLRDDGFRARVAALDIPALFVHGRQDPRSEAYPQRVAASMPQAEFHSIERAGHYPYLERPEVFLAVLRGFLTRILKTG
ncbi:MAG: alpha/beta fold hydrolase [Chloroflexi bacterium]|nr:alpha/beta fold hydrolase [Chloroflexota bacterium]